MVHGTVRSLFQLLGALGTTALILAAWLGLRLSEGPLNLAFLSPYIEDALSRPDAGFRVQLDETVLVWDGESHTLEVRAINARAVSDAQGVIASVPELSVAMSAPALMRGMIAPRRLRLLHPHIRLRRDAQGSFSLGMGDNADNDSIDSTQAVAEAFDALLAPPGAGSAASELQRVEVVGADLAIDDRLLGVQWHMPSADLQFLRDAQGISGKARLMLDVDGETSRIEADGHYLRAQRNVDALVSYGGLRPSLFSPLAPQLKPLEMLHLPTGGSVQLRYSLDRGLTDLRFDLAGGAGVIDASDMAGVSWPIASMALKGALTAGLNNVVLDEARVDLGGPVVTLSGHGENIFGSPKLDVSARIEDLPTDELKGLWPPQMAPNPREWILKNLSDGKVRLATAHLQAHSPMGKTINDLQVDSLGGEVIPTGVTVQYLYPMPVVKGADAVATFDQNNFSITVKSGEVMGLKVQEGKVVLEGLSAADQFADISLKIAGPVSDALRLIDSKPLGWAQTLGVQPTKVKGDAVTQLDMRFPLLANLKLDQLKVHAQAQTKGVAIPGVALGLDLTDGTLALDVDPKGMDVTGKAVLGGMASDIKWHENFSKAAPFRSRYQVQTVLDDTGRAKVGLDVAPFQAPFITGPVPVDLTAILSDGGRGDITIKADLTQASMQLPGLNWLKAPGVAGQATAAIRLAAGRLGEVPSFNVTSVKDGLDVQGQVAFENGQPRRVSFARAKWGKTDLKGSLQIKGGAAGLAVDVSGPSMDAREMISGTPTGQPKVPRSQVPPKDREDVVPLSIQAKVGQVLVSDAGGVRDVVATMSRNNRDWQQMHVEAKVGDEQKPMRLEMQPIGQNRRSLKLTSGDAGGVFRAFDVFQNLVGGDLLVDAYYDDADPSQPLKGQATVNDYHVVRAPALARLLTVAALTGVLDVLAGEGISFARLEAPFTLANGVLTFQDARAAGTALGITAKGQLDLDRDTMALEGTIVPAYAINSALGNLPLLGRLFSAEKGGGLVAMNYSMKGPSSDPSVMVNPLSALTPGFLRKLFNIFDDGSSTEVRPEKQP